VRNERDLRTEREIQKVTELIVRVKQIARGFEKAIFNSAQSPETERYKLTTHAVADLVRALREIDLEIGDNKDLKNGLREIFRLELQPLCLRGPLWNHALTKPYGYPGDFEILNAIYKNIFMTKDPVGYELDRAFLTSSLAEAVRNRKTAIVAILSEKIRLIGKSYVKMLDLGCGPCTDVEELVAFRSFESYLSIVCVDHEQEALDFAKNRVGQKVQKDFDISYIKANALRLKTLPHAPFDIIWSVGLLDYIPDQLAYRAIRNWWRIINNGGVFLLTVKDRNKYDPTFYDWMANWIFIPRTEEQLIALLLKALKITENQLEVRRDKTGIIIIVVATKS